MRRRDFLAATAAATLSGQLVPSRPLARAADKAAPRRAIYASPAEAMTSPRETDVFVTALRVGVDPNGKDYLAVVDVDPSSPSYSKVVHRVMMPKAGDELASYSSPVVRNIEGQRTELYFARGGMFALDPQTGTKRFAFTWRAKVEEISPRFRGIVADLEEHSDVRAIEDALVQLESAAKTVTVDRDTAGR